MTTTTTGQEAYARGMALLERRVKELNEALGYPTECPGEPRVTTGYLGNFGRHGDHRTWYVFLPHKGRVGTYDDLVGGWPTGDLDGLRGALAEVKGMVALAKHLKEYGGPR